MRTMILTAVLLSLFTFTPARAQESSPLPALSTEVAFPNLKFDRPVSLAYPDDGSNLLFVEEQHATRIWSFPNDKNTSDKKLFLQLPDTISRDNEEGLLGLAFHPKYKENGEFFVYYFSRGSRRPEERRPRPAFGRLAVPRLEGRPAQGRPVE